jgi:hypothetical protein
MKILAFLVLAGLGLVVLLTYSRRHRDRDRWPYNLANSPDTPGTPASDSSWSPSTNAAMVSGAVVFSDQLPSDQTHPSSDGNDRNDATESTSSSRSDHGATGYGEKAAHPTH